MERSEKQKEDGMKSRKIEDGIQNVGKTRGTSMADSRNVEMDGECLRPVDAARRTSAEGAVRSGEVEWRRRQKR
jgi:hypothetical protein